MRPIRCRLTKPSCSPRPRSGKRPKLPQQGFFLAQMGKPAYAPAQHCGYFGEQISCSASALSPIMCDVTLAVHPLKRRQAPSTSLMKATTKGRRFLRRLHAQRAVGLCQGSHPHADRPCASRYCALARPSPNEPRRYRRLQRQPRIDEVQVRTRELAQSVSELRALGEVSQAVRR